MVVKSVHIGRGMNTPRTIGEDAQRHAKFLAGNGSLERTVTHGDGCLAEGDETNFCIRDPQGFCVVQCTSDFVLIEVASGLRAVARAGFLCNNHGPMGGMAILEPSPQR